MTNPNDVSVPRWPWLLTGVIAILTALVVGVWAGPSMRAGWKRLLPEAQKAEGGQWYISQMHPWIIQPEPGQCPICGMDLTPIDPARFAAELSIDPVTIQNIGVRTAVVEMSPLVRDIRTVGVVAWDPGRVRAIEPRAMGWIRSLRIAAAGDPVTAGQVLLRMYSPELVAAQREYLAALPLGDAATAAAASKLQALGLPTTAWQHLRDDREVSEDVELIADISGLVSEKLAEVGDQIGPGMPALRIVDPSQVWVLATVYESQLADIVHDAKVTIDIGDGKPIQGTVAYVEPAIDPMTRAASARIVVENPEMRLIAGRYATVRIHHEVSESAVMIPREAVRTTGERAVVFIARGRGKFEPRTVTMGPVDRDGRVQIISGLTAGEAVVISGQFLLDSESRVKESIARMIGGGASTDEPTSMTPEPVSIGGASGIDQVAEGDREPINAMVTAIMDVHAALIAGKTESVRAAGGALVTALAHWRQLDAHVHHRLSTFEPLTTAAEGLATATTTEAQAIAFGLVGVAVRDLLRETGLPAGQPLTLIHCGMAKVAEGGWWIQRDDDVLNPYLANMRTCGEVVPW